MLLFIMCSKCLSQQQQYDTEFLNIGRNDIVKIQISKRYIAIILDSNFIKLHENENILKYHGIRFDFYHKSITIFDYYSSILPIEMIAYIKDNKLDKNSLIRISIWFLPEFDENVLSFIVSLKKSFSEDMLIYIEGNP